MAVTWSQRLDTPALQRLLASPQGGVMRDTLRRGLLVETQAKRNLSGIGGPKRIDTGRLRASIATVAVVRNGEPAVLVGTNVKYAAFVHNGTGIYGPRGVPIRPRTAKFLKFPATGAFTIYQPKKGKPRRRSFIYAQQVRGMKPNRFLSNALSAARG